MPNRLTWSLSMALACCGVAAVSAATRAQEAAQPPDAADPAPDADPAVKTPVKGPTLEGPPPIPERQLGPTLPTLPLDPRRTEYNIRKIPATILPREKSPEIDFDDRSSPFTRGETITGQASHASAPILDLVEFGKTGTLTLGKVAGAFQNGETITGDKGGSAAVKGSLRDGIWVLDFAFLPVRIQQIVVGGVTRQFYYMVYRVSNHTGKPRMFVPEFILVTDTGKVHRDEPLLPADVKVIQTREDPAVPLLGVTAIQGYVPPSTKRGIDDVVYGVACWGVDNDLARADGFKIYVRGLSDSLQVVREPGTGKSVTRYKTLRIDFLRRGDHHELKESEIELMDPPYEWMYW